MGCGRGGKATGRRRLRVVGDNQWAAVEAEVCCGDLRSYDGAWWFNSAAPVSEMVEKGAREEGRSVGARRRREPPEPKDGGAGVRRRTLIGGPVEIFFG